MRTSTDLTPAPYIRPRRGRRTYGLSAVQARAVHLDGDLWLRNRGGIVVYRNEEVEETDTTYQRHILVPRNVTMERIPGYWPPPPSFTRGGTAGEWVAYDWIKDPRELPDKDPKLGRYLFLRRIFFQIKRGHRSGQWRAYDIWPQMSTGQGPIWPWEPKRFRPGT